MQQRPDFDVAAFHGLTLAVGFLGCALNGFNAEMPGQVNTVGRKVGQVEFPHTGCR
jgi:hypothetical protein